MNDAVPTDSIVAASALIAATPDTASTAVVVGYNWTLVETAGGLGLVMTPDKGVDGARTTPETGHYTGRALKDLARLALSTNPYERAIGCAAINAGLNRFNLEGNAGDGLSIPDGETGRIVVVGRFPKLAEKLPNAVVLERSPGPDDLPAEAAPDVVPGCAHLIITASTWSNTSLAELLRLASDETHVTLVGPGTPLSPALFGFGISRLAGFVATDPDGLRQAVSEGAGVRQFKRFGREVTLEA